MLINVIVPVGLAVAGALTLHHRIYAGDIRETEEHRNAFGAVRVRIKLPGLSANVDEPILICGRVGSASLIFIRLVSPTRARVGVEFWGRELSQGDEFPLAAPDAVLELKCYVPAFFPEPGARAWKRTDPATQKKRTSSYEIWVNGQLRLAGATDYRQPPHSGFYLGVNPLGGSFVSARFSGTILDFAQEKLGASP
ncbi:MAG TPA: hypothetical protein VL200_08180 [Lacunisphaera sp.]|jgi:hypothetical protein|nr:hypothetical protein [Lacunisphaera sp.]